MMCVMSAAGYVGPPWPTNIVRIVDVPEMDYYAKNQKGEVSNSRPFKVVYVITWSQLEHIGSGYCK